MKRNFSQYYNNIKDHKRVLKIVTCEQIRQFRNKG